MYMYVSMGGQDNAKNVVKNEVTSFSFYSVVGRIATGDTVEVERQ